MRTVLSKFVIAMLVASGVTLVTSAPAQASCLNDGGDGSSGTPFQVSNAAEFAAIDDCLVGGSTTNFILTSDIHLTGNFDVMTFSQSSNTVVHLDGDNYSVTGLNIESSAERIAIFDYFSGSITDLYIAGSKIKTTAGNSGATYLSVLTTGNLGDVTFDNVHISLEEVNASSSDNSARVGGFITSQIGSKVIVRNSSLTVANGMKASADVTTQLGGVAGFLNNDAEIDNVQVFSDLDGSGAASFLYLGGAQGLSARTTNASEVVINKFGFEGDLIGKPIDIGSSNITKIGIGGIVGKFQANDTSGPERYKITNSYVRANIVNSGGGGAVGRMEQNNTGLTELISPLEISDSNFRVSIDLPASTTLGGGGLIGYIDDATHNNVDGDVFLLEGNFVSFEVTGDATTAALSPLYNIEMFSGSNGIKATSFVNNYYDEDLFTSSTQSITQETFQLDSPVPTAASANFTGLTTAQTQNSSNFTGFDFTSTPTPVWEICSGDAPNLVIEPNRCSAITGLDYSVYPAQTVTQGTAMTPVTPFSSALTASSAMNEYKSFTVSPALPDGLFMNIRTGEIRGTPLVAIDDTLYTATATNGFGSVTDTFTLVFRETSGGGSTAAPAPYTGPLVTSVGQEQTAGAFQTTSAATVTVYGERLSGVSKVFVEGKEAVLVSTSNDSFVMTLPDGLSDGVHDLVIQSSLGNLTYLDGLSISGETVEITSYGEVSAWAVRISDTQAKVYVKYPTVGERVRIGHQTGGSGDYTTVYVKTTVSENDEAMIVNEHGSYIVRTIDLSEINRIRVTVGDQTLVQVRYNR